MSLLAAPVVTNSHILTGIYFIFLKKNPLDQTWKALNTKFAPQWKDPEKNSQVKQILVYFYELVAPSF